MALDFMSVTIRLTKYELSVMSISRGADYGLRVDCRSIARLGDPLRLENAEDSGSEAAFFSPVLPA